MQNVIQSSKKSEFLSSQKLIQNVMKRPQIPLLKIFFYAGSGSKITHRVKKVAYNFTVEMDAE